MNDFAANRAQRPGLLQWAGNNSQTLMNMGMGLLGGRTGPEQWAGGLAGMNHGVEARKAEQQKNRTLEWLRRNAPDYADAVDAGALSIGDAYKMKLQAERPGQARFSTQPQLFERQDGSKVYGTFGSDGSFKEIDTNGLSPLSPLEKVDTGTEVIMVDRRTGIPVSRTPKENYQEKFDQAQGSEMGKRAGEMPALRSKALSAMDSLDQQRSIVNDEISRSIAELENSPNLSAGLVGGLSKAIPGTPAYGLAKKLETIKANVGFDKLQSMRENSPTGGALGQVSDFENRQLQSVFGNLEQAQSAEDIKYNLRRLQEILAQSRASRQEAFNRDFGGSAPANPSMGAGEAPTAPQGGNVTNWQDYF